MEPLSWDTDELKNYAPTVVSLLDLNRPEPCSFGLDVCFVKGMRRQTILQATLSSIKHKTIQTKQNIKTDRVPRPKAVP
jgi:hypothetical protein